MTAPISSIGVTCRVDASERAVGKQVARLGPSRWLLEVVQRLECVIGSDTGPG